MSVKIISLNAIGLRDTLKRRAVFNFYRSRSDIVCLQETHSSTEDEIIWSTEWGGDIVFAHGKTNARGVCTLLPRGMKKENCEINIDQAGRMVQITFSLQETTFTLCNIYAPNNDTPSFFQNIS